jgi:hypothetical protein
MPVQKNTTQENETAAPSAVNGRITKNRTNPTLPITLQVETNHNTLLACTRI